MSESGEKRRGEDGVAIFKAGEFDTDSTRNGSYNALLLETNTFADTAILLMSAFLLCSL